jgi:hypothetical protein
VSRLSRVYCTLLAHLSALAALALIAGCAAGDRLAQHSPPTLTPDENAALTLACGAQGQTQKAVKACKAQHLQLLAMAPRPQLDTLGTDDRLRINAACSPSQPQGPAEFRRCQARERAARPTDVYVEPAAVQAAFASPDPAQEPGLERATASRPQLAPASSPASDPHDKAYMANFTICLAGDRPASCRRERLLPEHRELVTRVEYRANLAACIDASPTRTCRYDLLTAEDARRLGTLSAALGSEPQPAPPRASDRFAPDPPRKARARTSAVEPPAKPAATAASPRKSRLRKPGGSSVPELLAAAGGPTCGSKRYCGQMSSCAEARFYLDQCGVFHLDGDHDGVPCERLC